MVSSYADDPTQVANPDDLRAALIARLNERLGYYAPPPAQEVTQPEPPAPSGFEKFTQTAGRGLGVLTSGANAANAIGGLFGHPEVGSDVQNAISSIPVVGRPLGFAADIATSPLTLATAGLGGFAGAGIRAGAEAAGIPLLGRIAAPLVEPLVQGSLPWRVGAAVAGQSAAASAENMAQGAGLPAPLQLGAGLLAGGMGAVTVGNTARAFAANAERNLGGLLPAEVQAAITGDDPAAKFVALLSEAKLGEGGPMNKALVAARRAENIRRTGNIMAELGGVTDPTEARNIVAAGQAGAMPGRLSNFDPARVMTPEEMLSIREQVKDHFIGIGQPYNYRTAIDSLDALLTERKLPAPNEVNLLQDALGPSLGGVVESLRGQNDNTLVKNAISLMAVPRALMVIGEFSVTPFKQAILGISTRQWRDSFAPMIKALNDPEFAAAKEAALRADTRIQEAIARGMQMTTLGAHGSIEEPFFGTQSRNLVSTLLNSVPGVQMSRRGMGTFLNSYRGDLIQSTRDRWERMGIEATPERLDSLSTMVNLLSGRSNTLKQFTGASGSRTAASLVNSGLFSPQLTMRNFDALNPKTYLSMDPVVRNQAMKTVGSAFGLGLTGLAALAAAGKSGILPVSIGTNPLNANFGKGQIGDTHIDLWGGFQPIARYAAQLLAGKVQSSSGAYYDQNRAMTLGNFGRSKLAPVPAFIIDVLSGTDSTGQSVDVINGQGVDRAVAERMAPIFAQNLAEAVKADGYPGLLRAFPPTVISTFDSTASIRAQGAKTLYNGKHWNELTGEEQANVNATYADKLAQQEPASGVPGFIQNVAVEQRAAEQQLMKALDQRQVNNATFTKNMNDVQAARVQQIQGVMKYTNAQQQSSILSDYYRLRDQATTNGIFDPMLLDQLQHNYYAALGPDDRRMIDERTGFAHAPEVAWWVNAKRTIADSEYYQAQSKAMEALAPLLGAVGASGLTYNQLRAAALGAETPEQAQILGGALRRVDAVTGILRTVVRAADPALDSALSLVYGSRPIRPTGIGT